MSTPGKGRRSAYDQLVADIERVTGLPCPPRGAPNEFELWAEHEVASNFLTHMRGAPDPGKARVDAAEFTLRNPVYPLEMLRPHIERGLGRKLTDEEFESRTVYD